VTLLPNPFIDPTAPSPQPCNVEAQRDPVDYEALFDAALPPEPPPLFLRKPSEAFMRALFELSR
jgi:hypothetical protein